MPASCRTMAGSFFKTSWSTDAKKDVNSTGPNVSAELCDPMFCNTMPRTDEGGRL